MRTFWREATLDSKLLSSNSTGLQLKNFRIKANLTQRDIGERLGYFNTNFMSMIEKDRTGIPANRFIDFMDAYDVPHDTRLELYARCFPVHWMALQQLMV